MNAKDSQKLSWVIHREYKDTEGIIHIQNNLPKNLLIVEGKNGEVTVDRHREYPRLTSGASCCSR